MEYWQMHNIMSQAFTTNCKFFFPVMTNFIILKTWHFLVLAGLFWSFHNPSTYDMNHKISNVCNDFNCIKMLLNNNVEQYQPSYTLASEMSLTAAASTMFLMTNFLIALSLGTQRAQLVQRTYLVWPRPFLERPLFLRFWV